MNRLILCSTITCLSLWSLCALGAGQRPLRLVAGAASCSTEEKSSSQAQLAIARMQAARNDLNLSHEGRCWANALKLEQYAYRVLEALEKQEHTHPAFPQDKAKEEARLRALQETMADLRDAEKAVEASMKTDKTGKTGVDVTSLDNAMHTLKDSYPG